MEIVDLKTSDIIPYENNPRINDKAVQELMERSALVIIDYDNALANGYVRLSKSLEDIVNNDE